MHKNPAIAAYDRVVALAATDEFAGLVARLRKAFEARTGALQGDAFEVRSRAFWDDAVTSGGFSGSVIERLSAGEPWLRAFERAHRGLFRVERVQQGAYHFEDVWSGAEFVLADVQPELQSSLGLATGFIDARMVAVASPFWIAVLPGAFFHPADATESIVELVETARSRALCTSALLDSLMRMESNLRTLSRVKTRYAYRPEALANAPATAG